MTNVTVRALSPALAGEFLRYFDEDAFVDNPEWSGCYCYLHHFPGSDDEWQESSAEGNRAGVEALIREGRFNGFLAFVDGQAVGWCMADIRAKLPNPEAVGPPGDRPFDQVGGVLCFNVAPSYRRQGIATQLLDSACVTLVDRGATVIEGYPRSDASRSAEH